MFISSTEKEGLFRRMRDAEAQDGTMSREIGETREILLGHVRTCAEQNESSSQERAKFRREMRGYFVALLLALIGAGALRLVHL